MSLLGSKGVMVAQSKGALWLGGWMVEDVVVRGGGMIVLVEVLGGTSHSVLFSVIVSHNYAPHGCLTF